MGKKLSLDKKFQRISLFYENVLDINTKNQREANVYG